MRKGSWRKVRVEQAMRLVSKGATERNGKAGVLGSLLGGIPVDVQI